MLAAAERMVKGGFETEARVRRLELGRSWRGARWRERGASPRAKRSAATEASSLQPSNASSALPFEAVSTDRCKSEVSIHRARSKGLH
eukprot:1537734-Rhodomonas_salina.1